MGADRNAAAERFQVALALFDLGERMLRQRLKRRRPEASEAQIDELVAQWLLRRPGAEHGDSQGRQIAWPRQRT
jgi:hypothetical protein